MICLQYASMLPLNHYINFSKTFQNVKNLCCAFQLSLACMLTIVGKSPYEQVDCLKELDPNSKT
jgi:hypothetical protein